jgi:hypothetical protein
MRVQIEEQIDGKRAESGAHNSLYFGSRNADGKSWPSLTLHGCCPGTASIAGSDFREFQPLDLSIREE